MYYIATISGGKDSVTMCDLLLKNGYPVDYIVFNDTLDEFEEMYEYLDKVEEYIKQRYNKSIIRLKPIRSYEEYIFRVRSKGDNIGKIMGIPNPSFAFCEWRRDSKMLPQKKWLEDMKIKNYVLYIGFTVEEAQRSKGDMNLFYNGTAKFPLIEHFKMSERNCQEYLINQEMENPLYRHFSRTGCQKCQYQPKRNWFKIWKYYPKIWQEMKILEKKVKEHGNAVSYNWFIGNKSCNDLEKEFIQTDKQGSLFDFSDEPLKDCFCKL